MRRQPARRRGRLADADVGAGQRRALSSAGPVVDAGDLEHADEAGPEHAGPAGRGCGVASAMRVMTMIVDE
ncbi:hypothetical protein [Micromonospora sp. M61]|uniref:hypothetical protein n=1 Tax=Micromonospora sp. M61 TaxID=2824890 RepID=UPI001B395671|nr:hypothetical protein [Micromonospora sp. M61]MBQ0978235.1 hypothetical protein [Micromonospora sp. M61]